MNVCIGYESRQPVAYQVCAHSVVKHAERPLSVTPLVLRQLPIKRHGLTEFTYSRFLTPFLSGFKGFSLFLDSDILVRADVLGLLAFAVAYRDDPVFMVKGPKKFEWPSVMLFNNELCKHLTPDFIEDPANKMYDYAWASSIRPLPGEWNHLVGYDPPNPNAKIVHFTKGVPVWEETKACEFSGEWHQALEESLGTVSHEELMGRSVHVAR